MVDYRVEVSTRRDSKENIFVLNLYTVPEMKLNEKSIYESEVCTVLNEANPNLNLYIFSIDLNDRWNLGSFGISIGYLYTGERKGLSVDKSYAKWMINIDAAKATLYTKAQLVIRSIEKPII